MNPDTANKLGSEGVDEYWALQQHLMTEIDNHKITDGYDFFMRCKIVKRDDQYLIYCEGTPIEGISSTRRDVIRALFDGASSNIGR